MLNKDNVRELAYLVKVEAITPMNADRLECAHIGGWHCVVGKGEFKVGDPAVYFEIDAQLPDVEPFASMEFLRSKHFKIKSQKIRGEISQGLLMPVTAFGWTIGSAQFAGGATYVEDEKGEQHFVCEGNDTWFLTEHLGVTYADPGDNIRKAPSSDKYKRMAQRHPNIFKKKWARWLMKREWGRKLMFLFFGKKKDKKGGWPVGKFPGVAKTDQERCENMVWVLNDKTPYIRTQKCDGSSGTYILEKKSFGRYEFYVCSRNVRMVKEDQECFYGTDNYYWEAAKKYDIQNKMKQYLATNKELKWVCWQGEICAPGIQKNPQGLTETHLFCFHMTDNINGRFDIRRAAEIWKRYGMEVVPIDEQEYILPDDFEEFKCSADGMYDASVCEGKTNQAREGYVYYKTTDPTFSFKNVSRTYLLKQN